MTWREIEAWDAKMHRGEITLCEWYARYSELDLKYYRKAKLIGLAWFTCKLLLFVAVIVLIMSGTIMWILGELK
jgi:hypothetical protein